MLKPLLHDDAGAEKADARHDIRDDADGFGIAGDALRKVDEGGRSDGDKHVGSQAGRALPVLPLRPDQYAEHEGGEQAHRRVEKRHEFECVNETHDRPRFFGRTPVAARRRQGNACRRRAGLVWVLLRGTAPGDHPMHASRRQVLTSIGLSGLVLAGGAPRARAAAMRPVHLLLDWIYQGPNSGFMFAKDKGFYSDAGLDVTITPGKGSGKHRAAHCQRRRRFRLFPTVSSSATPFRRGSISKCSPPSTAVIRRA